MRFLNELVQLAGGRTREQFFAIQAGPVLMAALPGPQMPRGFTTKDSTARTREVEVKTLGLPNPTSTVIYAVEKADRNKDARILCGRGLTADVIINHDSISKHHASFEERDGSWYVCDLGSRNGTTLREVKLGENEAHPLGDKAELSFGECAFTFYAPAALWKLLGQLRGTASS